MDPDVTVLHGDALEKLAELEDASVDAVVTDPPYEIGFMGKQWDASGIAYNVELWREALRVLKPGGHLLAFGATRTYHRMAVAIEDAGFEIRDSIHWLYASGFPKSHNVSKAIDRAMGAEREVVGVRQGVTKGDSGRYNWHTGDDDGPTQILDTVAATPEAARWEGWGTALKPAHEPIVMARKPLDGTVVDNVLEHGTGALNIEACRVSGQPRNPGFQDPTSNGIFNGSDNANLVGYQSPSGRWPANIILTHSEACVPRGTRKVASNKPVEWQRTAEEASARREASSYAVPPFEAGTTRSAYGDPDGTETVADWDCHPSCPVGELDRQTGHQKDGTTVTRNVDPSYRSPIFGMPTAIGEDRGYGGSGGGSRYFTKADWTEADHAFRYVAKPSKRERNAGLDDLPERQSAKYANGQGLSGRTMVDGQWVNTEAERKPAANFHPTVKPLALLRHLVKLVTPPGGTVLDPFTGSGTTLMAAVLERCNAIGVELTADYLPIIEARVDWARSQIVQPQLELELD